MSFSRQGYWKGLPVPSPGNIPNPGLNLVSHIAGIFFAIWVTSEAPRKFELTNNELKDWHIFQKSSYTETPELKGLTGNFYQKFNEELRPILPKLFQNIDKGTLSNPF